MQTKKNPYAVNGDYVYKNMSGSTPMVQNADGTTPSSTRPTYAGTYDAGLADLYDRISTRPAFSYDVTKDPLYQQYKGQYIQQGKLAMKDTMGQAAGLTGGYGSTYGQQVGQQAYDAYLQKLGDVVPELYNSAYSKYADEGDRLMNEYNLMAARRDDEYNRYMDDLSAWERDRAREDELAAEGYNRQQDAYSHLYSLIGSTGYEPSDDELAAAGMSREAADALRAEYLRSTGQLEGEGGGYGGGYGYGTTGGGNGGNDYTAEEVEAYIDTAIAHGVPYDDKELKRLQEEYGIKDKYQYGVTGTGGSTSTKPWLSRTIM